MRLWYLSHPQVRIDPAVPVPDCVPHNRHEALAHRFFAEPDLSADGWETARAAQARVLADLRRALAEGPAGDTLVVGHGGVGTLILCHFAGLAPSRRHDQPAGGGNGFCVDPVARAVIGPPVWQSVEAATPAGLRRGP